MDTPLTSSYRLQTTPLERLWLAIGGVVSLALIGAAFHVKELGLNEVFAFITGAICVYLTVKAHIWNFPIGLINNVFFGIVFLQSQLYADMSLQIVYFVLGVIGWIWWAKEHSYQKEGLLAERVPIAEPDGSSVRSTTQAQKGELQVGTTKPLHMLGVLVVTALATWAMYWHLVQIKDAAPFWDALTTSLSLAAQYLLTRKWIENWYFWIAADLIYVPLYFSRELYLSALLYALFLGLCAVGWREWKRMLREQAMLGPEHMPKVEAV